MIGVLLITHETLGAAYRSLAQHFFPDVPNGHIRILNVQADDDHERIIAQAQGLIPELDCGFGVLILTDIFGATPCNAAMKLVSAGRSAMLTGLNAPMLVKTLAYSAQARDLPAFVAAVKEAGVCGIMAFE